MMDTRFDQAVVAGKITGPGASSIKYDILTALLVTAARGAPVEARLALRLSLLITARYSWRHGTFAVGQREIARMWGVTERTAKREMSAMRTLGWIAVDVPAARGRVARYRIILDAVLRQTLPHWSAVGPDFVARMAAAPEPADEPSNVVPLHQTLATTTEGNGTNWPAAAERLQAQDPAVFNAWFSGLVPSAAEEGVMTLSTPSRFVADYVRSHFISRILAAATAVDRSVRDVEIVWVGG